MPARGQKKLVKSFRGIERVEIINANQRVKLTEHARKDLKVEGIVTDPRFGASVSYDGKVLYLVCFNGTLRLPSHIELLMKRGVDDVRRELFETYAPVIRYPEVLEAEQELSQMALDSRIPHQQVIDCLAKIYGATGLSLFAPYSELHSPPTLTAVKHDILTTRFDVEHQFKPYLDAALKGEKTDPLADLTSLRAQDLDGQVATIVYAVARQTDMPDSGTQEMRKAALDLARYRDYAQLRSLRNAMLTAGRRVEARIDEARNAMEKRKEDIVASLKAFDQLGVNFAAGLVQDAGALPRPITGDILVDRLVAVSLNARQRSASESSILLKAAATSAVNTGSARFIEDLSNARRALKVGAYIAYAAGQAGLDNRFADHPDRPPTAEEVRQAIQLADAGRHAAELEFEERRQMDQRLASDLKFELAQAPPEKARRTTRETTGKAAGEKDEAAQAAKEREDWAKTIKAGLLVAAAVGVALVFGIAALRIFSRTPP